MTLLEDLKMYHKNEFKKKNIVLSENEENEYINELLIILKNHCPNYNTCKPTSKCKCNPCKCNPCKC